MKPKIFVSFDYEHDKHYKFLLEAWNANKEFDLVFDDYSSEEINSNNIGRIKAALTNKIKESTHVLVISGGHTNTPHRNRSLIGHVNWINFESYQAVSYKKRIAVIKINFLSQIPTTLVGAKYSTANSFTHQNIINAINQAPFIF
ncbi:MAG: TIR domain-containing protein [Candidatus Pacebacteria bacterium]|nr:TIR domain-containing protein [Candidatus Paceibacterota bacterium]MBP9867081.1 TIR domain-containing protein [Candidatus Paceibacterota bacterium]